jgi:GAF domain-containing protein
MATREARHQLYEVLSAHKFELEIIRGVASGPDLEILDRRIEAARLLLEWISRALELEPPASPAVQTPPPSTSPVDRDQTPPSPPEPPKTSRQ